MCSNNIHQSIQTQERVREVTYKSKLCESLESMAVSKMSPYGRCKRNVILIYLSKFHAQNRINQCCRTRSAIFHKHHVADIAPNSYQCGLKLRLDSVRNPTHFRLRLHYRKDNPNGKASFSMCSWRESCIEWSSCRIATVHGYGRWHTPFRDVRIYIVLALKKMMFI